MTECYNKYFGLFIGEGILLFDIQVVNDIINNINLNRILYKKVNIGYYK